MLPSSYISSLLIPILWYCTWYPISMNIRLYFWAKTVTSYSTWYNTLTRENNWFLKVLVKSHFATPTPFGSVSCFVKGVCQSNYNLYSFLIHQAPYSKGYQWYLFRRAVFGSIWKIGRYPIKVSAWIEIILNTSCIYNSLLKTQILELNS